MIKRLSKKIIVSCQAMPSEPLYKEECMRAMMESVLNGGAQGLRVAGIRDVKMAKSLTNVPVIGITKPEVIPKNWKDIVYITPTIKDVVDLIQAGADIIAFDGTSRPRPNCTLEEIIKYIKINKKKSMADISTLEEGLICAELDVDIISTTLSGYTTQSPIESDGPDFNLLKKLVKETNKPIILEGRIWEPDQINKAFDLGAHAVVIGSAITRPQLITKRFITRVEEKYKYDA